MDEFLDAEKQQAARCDPQHPPPPRPRQHPQRGSSWSTKTPMISVRPPGLKRLEKTALKFSKMRFLDLWWYFSSKYADRF